jgi:uncharacterized protein YxjI
MENLYQYPIDLQFKITTLHNDFEARDANGSSIAYVKQKLFKFKEDISVFSDISQTKLLFKINADRWLDFNTVYQFTDAEGKALGRVGRKGWRSLWKSRYELYDENGLQDLLLSEENAWIKVADALFQQIPVLGLFTGYIFNPKYTITRPDGTLVCRLVKEPSFVSRKFTIENYEPFEQGEEQRILLGVFMMILLERRKG